MTGPDPFSYPASPHRHAHAPAGYEDYQSFKPWLRDDFAFRCVYCLTRERWDASPTGHAGFGADHVVPQSADPSQVVAYANLVYACNACNSARRAEPLPINPLADGLGGHVAIDETGRPRHLTPGGADLIALFALADAGRTAQRAAIFALVRAKTNHPGDADIDHLYRRAFGYPDDLPDLAALKPPLGNANAGSEAASHHARKARGELPDVY